MTFAEGALAHFSGEHPWGRKLVRRTSEKIYLSAEGLLSAAGELQFSGTFFVALIESMGNVVRLKRRQSIER